MAEKSKSMQGKTKPPEPEQALIQSADPETAVEISEDGQTAGSPENQEKNNAKNGVVNWGVQRDTLPYYLL